MEKFKIEHSFVMRNETLIMRVSVLRYNSDHGLYVNQMDFVNHIDKPSWLSRKLFKETFEGRCDEAMRILTARAKYYIDQELKAEMTIQKLKEKYK